MCLPNVMPVGDFILSKFLSISIDNSVHILTDKTRVSLSEYISRAPVSLEKLHYEPFKGRVLFHTRYNDYFKENVHMFEGLDSFAELTQHIPPKGIKYIRRYGLYSSRTRVKWTEHPEIVRHAPLGWKAAHQEISVDEEIIDEEACDITEKASRKAVSYNYRFTTNPLQIKSIRFQRQENLISL